MNKTQQLVAATAHATFHTQKNLEALFEQAPALIAIFLGPDHKVSLCNPQFRKILGERDVLGLPLRRAFPELEGQGWFEIVEHVYRTGEQASGVAKPALLDRGGGKLEQLYFDFVYQPYRDEAGKIAGVTVFGVDVTAQVRANEGLVASEERYQAFIRHSNEGIWRVELDEPILATEKPAEQIKQMYERAYLAEANMAMAKMYGFRSPEDLEGLRLTDLLVQSDPRNTEYLMAFIKSGYSLSGVDSHEVDRHGHDKYFRNSLVGVIENGMIVRAWGTQQDVTEQHLAENALRSSEARLALALKASKMGFWEWNVQTGDLMWSDELKVLFGLKPTDEITYERYLTLLHPDDRANSQRVIQEAMESGKEYRMEHRCVWPDGSEHWLLGQGKAFRKNGVVQRMLGTTMNIDDRKSAENELHQTEAINAALKNQQAELLALNNSKDEFISLASHQLRTPATGVKQYIGMLREGYCGDITDKQRKFLDIAYESNERQLRIIDDLLKVAHVDAGKITLTTMPTDLAALIYDVIAEQSSAFEQRQQRIVFKQPRAHITAVVDPARMRMVLENLIDNASKYSPKGKAITVELAERPGTVIIRIMDSGVGIAKKDLAKLFQKFSRVSNELSTLVGGTGLGLYWAKKIVDLHGGSIVVTSQVHKGSVFELTLPANGLQT